MLSLVFRTLVHFRGLLFPVTLGVAVATAVILGALVVGDSMRGSLRFIALDRIGEIESVLVAPRWFEQELAQNLAKNDPSLGTVHPLIFVQQSIVELDIHRASEVALLGVDSEFWNFGAIQPKRNPEDEEVILNQSLADKLQSKVGDLVTLRVASQSVVPADSPLGKREQDSIVLPRWKVIEILPDRSLARFSLRSDQRPIMNAFVGRQWLQKGLEIASKVNAVLIARSSKTDGSNIASGNAKLLEKLSPALSDLGLTWQHVQRTFPDRSRRGAGRECRGNEAENGLAPRDNFRLRFYGACCGRSH